MWPVGEKGWRVAFGGLLDERVLDYIRVCEEDLGDVFLGGLLGSSFGRRVCL